MQVKSRPCLKGHVIDSDNVVHYIKNGKPQTSCKICRNTKQKLSRLSKCDFLPPETKSVMKNYKEPLRKIEDGYGYYGTIAYDEAEKFTQCHVCGNFFKSLGSHVSRVHKIIVKDYRDKFGLAATVSLLAPKANNGNFEQWENMSQDERKKSIDRMKANRSKRKMPNNWRKKSLYQKNLEGRCPDQTLDKIMILADKLNKTPTRREFQKEYGNGMYSTVCLEFGSWNNAVKLINLTTNPKGANRYDSATLLMRLFDFREQHGREPMSSDCDRGLLPSRQLYRRHFGSFTKAKLYVIKNAGQ